MKFVPKTRPGYHETPLEVIRAATGLIVSPETPAGITILDPCAGEGRAAAYAAQVWGVDQDCVYAIESSVTRARTLAEVIPLGHVLGPCAFESVTISPQVFSVLILHPPHADEHGGGLEVAQNMARRAFNYLCPEGIAIVSADSKTWANPEFAKVVAQHIDIAAFLPKWKSGAVDCATLIGSRRKRLEPYASIQSILRHPRSVSFEIPRGRHPSVWQRSGVSDDEVIELLNRSPLMAATEPPEVKLAPSPPMELARGHVALLLASGFLNGVIHKPGEPPHVVRGTARKAEVVASSEDGEDDRGNRTKTTIYTERIELNVRVLTSDGKIHELSSAESAV